MTQTEATTRSRTPDAAAAANCVTLDSVSKIYGSFAALRNVSTSFAAGSCTVILGENGAGKSTLLRIVAGLLKPTRGNVTVFNEAPHKQRRRMAYMSHSADALRRTHRHREPQLLRLIAPQWRLRLCRQPGDGSPRRRPRPSSQTTQSASTRRACVSAPPLHVSSKATPNCSCSTSRSPTSTSTLPITSSTCWPTSAPGPYPVAAARTILITTHQAALAKPLADSTLTLRNGQIATPEAAA